MSRFFDAFRDFWTDPFFPRASPLAPVDLVCRFVGSFLAGCRALRDGRG